MLTPPQRRFLHQSRVAHLATADAKGAPHLVPVCFTVECENLYITIDEKPKRQDIPLKRLRNIQENPEIAVTADRWDEDWTRLVWVMLRGPAEILRADVPNDSAEHDHAQALLREKYPQYSTMALEDLPVIAMRIKRVLSWGDLPT